MVVRIPAAYPLFEVGYQERSQVLCDYLERFENLQVAGRGGLFRYYNTDQAIASGSRRRKRCWGVTRRCVPPSRRGCAVRCALIFPAWLPARGVSAPDGRLADQLLAAARHTLRRGRRCSRAGHEVRFFNGAFLTHEEILRRVGEFDPHFAGIYSVTFGWNKAMQTAAAVKRLNPEIFTCAGGPYPIAMQEHCLHDCAHFDAVGTGEGELTVPEMLERLESGRSLDGVLGVAFRRGAEIVKNPPRPLIEDLDALPFPARELLRRSMDPTCRRPAPTGASRSRS